MEVNNFFYLPITYVHIGRVIIFNFYLKKHKKCVILDRVIVFTTCKATTTRKIYVYM